VRAAHRTRRAGIATAAVILAVAVLAAASPATGSAAGSPAAGPGRASATDPAGDAAADVTALSLAQHGPDVTVAIAGPHPGSVTRARPVCITFGWHGNDHRRACLTRTSAGTPVLSVTDLDTDLRTSHAVDVTRTARGLRFVLTPLNIALVHGTLGVHLGDCEDCDRVPDTGEVAFRYARPITVGCVAAGPPKRSHGPAKMTVGLSFDDGPAAATTRVARLVRHYGVRATFFQIGRQVPGQAETEHTLLADGDTIGDHSWQHETLPSRTSMARTRKAIMSESGFTPCLFRPPGGATDSRVEADAWSLGMNTILWNVDPRDWSRPGADAITTTVLHTTHPGSIILLHDGGGDRSETLAALPRILSTLLARGYRIVPVEELLGLRMRYRYS
jgi:peptidoglycan/xylan/chitin deacetylase (PgdA/CDA1 family)